MAWFETWFDTPYYHILYKDRDFTEAENFITLLINYLQIQPDSKIIDLACGKGRHSVFLNKMGFEVLGLDLSKKSIESNKNLESATLKFKVHDMRHAIYPQVCKGKVDAVFNLFTSFGYFEEPADDKKVFQSISNCLSDNGFFVLDFLNANWVANTIIPEETVIKDNINFAIQKKIDSQHILKNITFSDQGEEFTYFEKVKLHTLQEINDYAEQFGMERIAVFGDYELKNFDENLSPRCIIIFKKKS